MINSNSVFYDLFKMIIPSISLGVSIVIFILWTMLMVFLGQKTFTLNAPYTLRFLIKQNLLRIIANQYISYLISLLLVLLVSEMGVNELISDMIPSPENNAAIINNTIARFMVVILGMVLYLLFSFFKLYKKSNIDQNKAKYFYTFMSITCGGSQLIIFSMLDKYVF